MPKTLPQLDVTPVPHAINQYFELSLYLLVLMGFGALASTGGLGLPTILLVGAALALRGYLLAEQRRVVILERWTTPLTIGYFAFYAVDYFLLSRSFLTSTVHLVLFAVVVRSFSLRRDRDYTMLAILAFLMVLASAVLTVDSVFLLFFAGFMLMAVATFILMEMRQSGRTARFQARHSQRCEGAPASCLFAGAGDTGFGADDISGRSSGVFSSAAHVGGLPGQLLVRHRFF